MFLLLVLKYLQEIIIPVSYFVALFLQYLYLSHFSKVNLPECCYYLFLLLLPQ